MSNIPEYKKQLLWPHNQARPVLDMWSAQHVVVDCVIRPLVALLVSAA